MQHWKAQQFICAINNYNPNIPWHQLTFKERQEVYERTTIGIKEHELEIFYASAVSLGVIPRFPTGKILKFLDRVDTIQATSDGDESELTKARTNFLEGFPIELVHQTLSTPCLEGVIRYRNSSPTAEKHVESHLGYQFILKNAPMLFKALINMGLASDPRFTLPALVGALQKSSCEGCEDPNNGNDTHGFLLFLPTLTRCCLKCLPYKPQFTVYRTPAPNQPLPVIPPETRQKRLETLRQLYPPDFDPSKVLLFKPLQPVRPAEGSIGIVSPLKPRQLPPSFLYATGPNHPALHDDGAYPPSYMQIWDRYTACMVIPHLDKGEVKPPRRCKGCYDGGYLDPTILVDSRGRPATSRPGFLDGPGDHSTDTFMDHFQRCRQAQEVWADSKRRSISAEQVGAQLSKL